MDLKVSIIGVGHVGATIGYALVLRGACDEIVLVNRSAERAMGEAADLRHATAFAARAMSIHAGGIEATEGSDLVIVSASVRTNGPGSGRDDLLLGNAEIMRMWITKLVELNPQAIFLIVTNPVDTMTYLAWRTSGLPASRVIGSGTLIDSARFRSGLSRYLQIHPEDIRAYVLGEHGDSQFPALSVAATGGQRLDEDPNFAELFDETVSSAHEIFRIKGYTNYAIASATHMIAEAILTDSHRTLPVSSLIDGYLGVRDVCLSIPCVIGRAGIVRQLYPELSIEEASRFRESAEKVRRNIARADSALAESDSGLRG